MAKRKPTEAEYRFKIDAYSPDTIPMSRLAEYMSALAEMLGEQKSVHFERLETGSTVIVHKVEREAVPKVRDRATAVRRNEGPADAQKAYRAVNKLLREDNAVGALRETRGVILNFPGRDEAEEKYPTIKQQGTIDGIIVSVGGADQTVHVRLLAEGTQVSGCYTNSRQLGKELARRFDESVRLVGVGNWNRDSDGKWTMASFRIDSYEPLKNVPLSDALAELREISLDFDESTYAELDMIRHGPPDKANGGH